MRFDFKQSQFIGDQGERCAVVGTDRQLTWSELKEEVATLVERIQNLQGPIVIHGHKEVGMVSTILACWCARVPYIPMDNMNPAGRLERASALAGAKWRLDAATMELVEQNLPGGAHATAPDLAYIIFTSGSTGEPKGVQIQRENVFDLVEWARSSDFGFAASDVVLSQCSFSFDVSFFDLVATLQVGGTLILGSAKFIQQNGILKVPGAPLASKWSSTPSYLSMALTLPGFDASNFPHLKKFYVAGEAVRANLAQRLWSKFPQGELWNAYGPTEATVITTLIHVTPQIAEKYPLIPIGFVKPGVSMPTAAADGVSEGELCIVGPNVSPGYLNRPDLNTEKFGAVGNARLYRTGDIGFHQDGMVFCKGRIDSQIKMHGYRIELDEIDTLICKLQGVKDSATVALKRDGEVKRLVAFVRTDAGQNQAAAIKEHLQKHLPYYMIPAEIRLVEELPYNANQKVDRSALTAQLESGF